MKSNPTYTEKQILNALRPTNATAMTDGGSISGVEGSIYVGHGGTVVGQIKDGGTVTFKNVQDGTFIDVIFTAIYSDTDATGILILE